ncbi:MAG: GNAT family N-acetyltransferase [Rhodospirillaceae bacterium]|nr:GNAT family N-acetyltransferase [Rhodospirillales bacterium]
MPNAYLSYRPVTIDDAQMILDWRTSPDITRYMYTDVEYDLDKQRAWIERTQHRSDFHHRLICVEGIAVGYASIQTTDAVAGIGSIGVYIGDRRFPATMTALNFVHSLNHAFCTLNYAKIVNHILGINSQPLRSQRFTGYRPAGILAGHAVKNGEPIDVHVFEQSRSDWLSFRRKFKDWRDWDGQQWPPELYETDASATA